MNATGDTPLLRIDGICKRFGSRPVLQNVDLALAPGTVTALVGPNGAGKTTLGKIVLGLVRQDTGTVWFDGVATNGQVAHRARIGYMPQTPHYPESLTGGDVLQLLRALRGEASVRDVATTDTELVERFGVTALLDRPARTLSGGERQRLNAVTAFLFDPELLILDEPTASLDPVAAGLLKDEVRARRAAGRTVLVTSHVLSDLQELADDVVFLHEGTIPWAGPLDALLADTGEATLERAIARLMTQGRSAVGSRQLAGAGA